MCVASKLWIKLGGKADACFCELTIHNTIKKKASIQQHKIAPSAGELGSEMYTVCSAVNTCLRFVRRYGCTMGNPNGVDQMTEVICSFLNLVAGKRSGDCDFMGLGRSIASGSRSEGMDFVMRRAVRLSQF
jgi:hypothetical protein